MRRLTRFNQKPVPLVELGGVPGTVIGGAVGGIIGSFGSSWLGTSCIDYLYGK